MMNVAVCQYRIERLEHFESYVNKITAIVHAAKQQEAQLLLLPEYAGIEIGSDHQTDKTLFASFQPLLEKYCELYKKLSAEYHLYIQPGTVLVETKQNHYINRAFFFGPAGNIGYQDKLQLTEYEKNSNLIVAGRGQTVFNTSFGRIGIAICYDSEFPEIIRNLVMHGAHLILVPSYTTSLAGFHRVSLSARARAIENQCYIATAFTVGFVEMGHEPYDMTTGQASIVGPVETMFSDDGMLVQGKKNEVMIVTKALSFEQIEDIRKKGDVRNYHDFMQYYAHNQMSNVTLMDI